MKLRSILIAAGLFSLVGAQSASASSITLEVYGGVVHQYVRYGTVGPSLNPDGSVNPGQGLTYAGNMAATGNSGSMTFTNGGGTTLGSWNMVGNVAAGNLSVAYANPSTPQFLRDVAAQDSMQFSFKGTVGQNDNFHIINALAGRTIIGTGIAGLAAGSLIDQDLSDPFAYGNPANFGLSGYTGGAALFVHNGAPDPRINLGNIADSSPTCIATGLPGCIGDQTNLLRPGFNGQNAYMQVRYDGFVELLSADGNFYNTYQLFTVRGQNALVPPSTGVTRAHLSILDVQIRYLSGTRAVNGGGGGTPVPEPMTMSLLGGALGVGALRRRFKKA